MQLRRHTNHEELDLIPGWYLITSRGDMGDEIDLWPTLEAALEASQRPLEYGKSVEMGRLDLAWTPHLAAGRRAWVLRYAAEWGPHVRFCHTAADAQEAMAALQADGVDVVLTEAAVRGYGWPACADGACGCQRFLPPTAAKAATGSLAVLALDGVEVAVRTTTAGAYYVTVRCHETAGITPDGYVPLRVTVGREIVWDDLE